MEGCLVVIYSRSGESVGRRIPASDGLTLGRDEPSDVVLGSERLSRRHCQLAQSSGGWLIRDLGSTNGTVLNGKRITEAPLVTGDVVEAGGVVLNFLVGADADAVEQQYHDVIYRMSVEDGLTGLCNRRYSLDVLRRETERARRYRRPLGLILLNVDEFRRINEQHGYPAGDQLLRRIARALRQELRRDDTLGRYGPDTFMVILPETSGSGLREVAEGLRVAVFGLDEDEPGEVESVPATVSVGVTSYDPTWEPSRFVEVAEAAVLAAKRAGRNRVALARTEAGGDTIRELAAAGRVLDGPSLMRRALGLEQPGPMLAFELEEEPLVQRCLGRDGLERWLEELGDDVMAATTAGDLVGRWRPRSVLLALGSERPAETVDLVRRRVTDRFGSRPVPAGLPVALERRLRWALLPAEELLAHGPEAAGRLVARLRPAGGAPQTARDLPTFNDDLEEIPETTSDATQLPDPDPELRSDSGALRLSEPTATGRVRDPPSLGGTARGLELPARHRELPSVLAAPLHLATHAPSAASRAMAAARALEASVRLLVASQLGWIASLGSAGRPLRGEATTVLAEAEPAHGPLPIEEWLRIAEQLAELCDAQQSDVLTVLQNPLFDDGKTDLGEQLKGALGFAADLESLNEHEGQLRTTVAALMAAWSGLGRFRFCSVQGVEGLTRADDWWHPQGAHLVYQLGLHRGPTDEPVRLREELATPLVVGGTYLLGEAARPPLPLSSAFFARACELCGRHEVFATERPALGSGRSRRKGESITLGHEATAGE